VRQKTICRWNRCVEALNKGDALCAAVDDFVVAAAPETATSEGAALAKERAALLKAVAAQRAGRVDEAVELLAGMPAMAFARAQMLEAAGRHTEAASALDDLPPAMRSRPGVCAAVVALRKRAGDAAGVVRALEDSAARARAAGDVQLCKRVAALLAARGEYAKAAAIYEAVVADAKQKPDPARVEALARVNLARAEQLCRSLPPMPPLMQGVTADALECLPAVTSSREARGGLTSTAATATTATAAVDKEKEDAKRKRKRARKKKWRQNRTRPKLAAAVIQPDPERWKPKRERTGYRAPKARGRGANRRDQQLSRGLPGAQNAAAEQALAQQRKPISEPAKTAPAPPPVAAAAAPPVAHRGAASRKKKR